MKNLLILITLVSCTSTTQETTYDISDIRMLACVHGYINGVIDTKHPEDGGTTIIKAAAKFCNKEYK